MTRHARTTAPASPGHRSSALPRSREHPGLALGLLCLAQFMVVLDLSIVNVALPAIRADLGFISQAGLQYVISLYALTFGGSLILAGRLGDLCGRRRLFMTGLVLFAAMSLACGLAPNPATLLAARAAQGIASALTSASALALVTTMFAEGTERNRALGAWGAVGGAAGACGLILGGALTGLAGWPWVFFLNLPIAAGAALAAPHLLPADGDAASLRRIDVPGALTVTLGLGLLIFGLTRAEQAGFTSAATLGLLVLAVVVLSGFVGIEKRARHPLVAFRLFRTPGIAGFNVAGVLLTSIIASNLFFTTLYAQQVLGFSPLQTGLAFLPNSVLVLVGSATATRLARRVSPGALLTVGFAVLGLASVLLSGVSPDGAYVSEVLPGFALTGLGLGLGFVAVTMGATRGLDPRDHGLASGVVNTAQQVGFAVGIAAVVAAAHAFISTGAEQTSTQVSINSAGYLVDAAIAVAGIVTALLLVRTGRPTRSA